MLAAIKRLKRINGMGALAANVAGDIKGQGIVTPSPSLTEAHSFVMQT